MFDGVQTAVCGRGAWQEKTCVTQGPEKNQEGKRSDVYALRRQRAFVQQNA
jgi:hypothetical protein